MLKRFISYYGPHKKMLTLDMLAALFISVIGMVYPIVTNKMLNEYIPNKMYRTIVLAGAFVLVLYFVRMLLRYFVQYYGHVIGVRMQSKMRRDERSDEAYLKLCNDIIDMLESRMILAFEDMIALAELYRNVGEFEKCLLMLNGIEKRKAQPYL